MINSVFISSGFQSVVCDFLCIGVHEDKTIFITTLGHYLLFRCVDICTDGAKATMENCWCLKMIQGSGTQLYC